MSGKFLRNLLIQKKSNPQKLRQLHRLSLSPCLLTCLSVLSSLSLFSPTSLLICLSLFISLFSHVSLSLSLFLFSSLSLHTMSLSRSLFISLFSHVALSLALFIPPLSLLILSLFPRMRVHSKRSRAYRQNASVLCDTGVCFFKYTRGRFERTHGSVSGRLSLALPLLMSISLLMCLRLFSPLLVCLCFFCLSLYLVKTSPFSAHLSFFLFLLLALFLFSMTMTMSTLLVGSLCTHGSDLP